MLKSYPRSTSRFLLIIIYLLLSKRCFFFLPILDPGVKGVPSSTSCFMYPVSTSLDLAQVLPFCLFLSFSFDAGINDHTKSPLNLYTAIYNMLLTAAEG